MLSDFLHARFCLDFDDSEGTRTIRRGRESLSLSPSVSPSVIVSLFRAVGWHATTDYTIHRAPWSERGLRADS